MTETDKIEIELANIVSDAYEVFQVTTPVDVGTCHCCMSTSIRSSFFEYAPKNLPLEYVKEWFGAATDPEVDQHLWRWLLPRLMEFLVEKKTFSMAIEIALRRFRTGDQARWSPEEWSVLERFRFAFIESKKIREPFKPFESPEDLVEPFLDDIMCMFEIAGWNARDLFSQIWDWTDEELVARFWNDWCSWTEEPDVWITAFWEEPSIPLLYYTDPGLKNRVSHLASKGHLFAEKVLIAIYKIDS